MEQEDANYYRKLQMDWSIHVGVGYFLTTGHLRIYLFKSMHIYFKHRSSEHLVIEKKKYVVVLIF